MDAGYFVGAEAGCDGFVKRFQKEKGISIAMKKSIISRKKSKKKQLAAGVLAILLGMFPWTSQSNVFGQTVSLTTTNPAATAQYANLNDLRLAGLGAQPWGETNTITLLSEPTMFGVDTSLTTFLDFAGNTATINRSADVNPNTHLISGSNGNFSFIRVLASDFDNHKTLTLNQINVGRFGDTAVSTRAHNITSGALSYNINGTRVVFDGNGNATADAGAIYIANGTLTLTGGVGQSAFLRNQAQNGGAITAQLAHVNITNTLFGKDSRVANSYGGNIASTDGGAIYIRDNSTATAHSITSSEFYENRARNGAGIYVTAADLTLTGGQFGNNDTNTVNQHSNEATGSGGAIYITDGAPYSGGTRRPVLNVQGTGFYYNEAGATGGAIYAQNATGTLTLGTDGNRTNFRGNTAGTGGGAVYVQNGMTTMLGNLNVSAGTINENTATTGNGGAFFGQYVSNVDIDVTNRVQYNEATAGSGGVFYFMNGDSVNYMMNQLTLDLAGGLGYNTAGANGGVLFGQNVRNVTINTGSAEYNTAGTSGGVFYLNNGTAADRLSALNITTGNLLNNQAMAGNGGVFFAQNAGSATITIGTAETNTAAVSGGVFYFDNGTTSNRQSTLNITAGYLDRNRATAGSGGVLYAQNAGNATINLQGNVYRNVAANSGGAFYFNNDSAATELSTLTINHDARRIFDYNEATAGDGGAIRADYIRNATFSNLLFTRNTANANVGHGGALAMFHVTGTIRLDNNTYFGGSATNTNSAYDGGAVYVSNGGGGSLVVDDAHFHTNDASHRGGAIHSQMVTTTVGAGNTGSLFQDNQAADRGGAIYINTADLTVGNNAGVRTRFLSNQATNMTGTDTYGGAIAAEAPMFGGWTVDINYADFTTSTPGDVQPVGNYASYGGAIAVQSPSVAFLEIDNSTFTYNNADKSGGAVWTQNTLVEITNSVFGSTATEFPTVGLRGNIANGSGGALAIGRSYENTQSNNNFYHAITDSRFYRNRAHETDTAAVLDPNTVYRGGAIFVSQSTMEIRSTVGSGANATRFEGNIAVHRAANPAAVTGWLNGGGAIAITDDQTSVASAEYRSGLLINDIVTHPGGAPIASDTMIFTNNTAGSGYNNDGTYSLDTAVFRGGGNGGAILATNSSIFKIYNAAFTNNSAFMHNGPGIGTAYGEDRGGYGGAIALFRDVQQADPANGNPLPLNAIHHITNSTFDNNTSHYYGGAISAMTLNPGPAANLGDPNHLIRLEVDGSALNGANMFNNNRSYVGGAIYANGARTTVESVVFNGNKAMKMGDAVYGPADAPYGGAIATDGTLPNGTFTGLEGSTLTINGSTFTGNSAYHIIGLPGAEEARGEGGAVRTNLTVATIADTLFQNNSSASGGALAMNKTDYRDAAANSMAVPNLNIVRNTNFTNNTAYDYDIANQATTVDVVTRGGAIYVLQTNATITGTAGANHAQFTGNSVVHRVLDRYILDKEAHGGGAIAVSDRQGGGEENFEAKLYVQYADFTNNTAQGQGGAIYAMNALELRVTDSIFTDNNATAYRTDPGLTSNGGSGGAIAIMRKDEGNGELLAADRNAVVMSEDENTTFTNNTAAVSGGAISIRDFTQGAVADDFTLSVGADRSNPTTQTPSRTEFTGNRAGQKGGAIYGHESDVYVYYTDFDSNVTRLNVADPISYNEKGGAIAIEGGTLTINKDTLGVTVQNSRVTFTNNVSSFQGGAIYIGAGDTTDGLLTASGADFGNADGTGGNTAIQGGAIYLDGPGNGTHTVELSTFYGNQATAANTNVGIFGGAIAYVGGVAQDNNANLDITGTVFEGNSVSYTGPVNPNLNLVDGGGAIAFYNAGTLTLNHFGNQALTSFTDNSAEGLGGAIHLRTSGAFNVDNIEFTGNNAIRRVGASVVNSASGSGGAIAVQAGLGATDIANSTFDSNTAAWKGGAIYTEGTDLNLNWTGVVAGTGGNTFVNNEAGSGGAIYADISNVVSYDDTYTRNRATGTAADGYIGAGSGGAIAVKGDGTTTYVLNVSNGNFTRNEAAVDGGAIFSNEYYIYIDGVNGSSFSNNEADRDGGAVAVINTANRGVANALQIGDAANALNVKTSFLNSAAGRHGGAVWASYADTDIYRATFSTSTAQVNGGAVGVEYGTLNIEDGTFTVSTATTGSGGAVYVRNSQGVSISRTVLTTSTANQSGGGVYATNVSGNLTIDASEFTTSTAGQNGGGVYAGFVTGNVVLDDVNFTGSTATNGSGGGVYATNVTGNLTIGGGTEFTSSTAGQNGGAVYAGNVTGNVVIDGAVMTDSGAGTSGGAVHVDRAQNLNIENTDFTDSIAAKNGGTIHAANVTGVVTIADTNITRSEATSGDGGSVYVENAPTVNINTVNFRDSSAGGDGGTLYVTGANRVNISNSGFGTNNNNGSTAGGSGGAIYVAGQGTILNIATTTNFIGNAAGADGGALALVDNGGSATLSSLQTSGGGTFRNNTAGGQGGAIYLRNTAGGTGLIQTAFVGNQAVGNGGAVSIERDATTLAAGTQSYTFTDSNFTSNNSTGGLGGAINVLNDSGATTNLRVNAVNRNVVFDGNTDSRGDNDIYVRGTDTYFNAAQNPGDPDEGYKISLNGGIDSDATIYKDGAGILAIYANSNGAALDVRAGELIIGGNRPGDESNIPGKTLTITGGSTLRAGTKLSVGVYENYRVVGGQHEDSALRTGTFTAEAGSILNINAFHHVVQPPFTGEDWADPARNPIYTLVEADEEINKEGTYQFVVSGMVDGGGDYLRTYLWFAERKTEDNKNKIQLGAGLVWFNTGNDSAHGTFCIAPGETFTISGLYDNEEAVSGAAGYTYTDPDSGQVVTWDGRTLTKDCLGTLILEGTNDYTGDTIIKRGTLIAAHAENGVIVSVGRPSTGEIDVWSGATFQIGQENKKIAGTLDKKVTGGGDVVLYAADGGAITFTNNTNDYTGTTRIMSGTGKITAINAFGDATDRTQSVVVAGDAIFEIATGGTFSQLIDGQGALLKSGKGILVLNNGNTYLGGTTVADGRLKASHVDATGIVDAVGRGPVQVDEEAFLELDTVAANGKAEFRNDVTGQGGLVVNVGNGNEMTLSSSGSDYIGLTDIQTGNARLTHANGTGANTADTTVRIAANSSLEFDFGRAAGENTTYRKNITGGGEMIKSGVDTVTLTNDNRYFTGETTVDNGRLVAKHINAVGSGDVHVVNPTSTFEIAAGGVFDNDIDGAGNFDINPGREQTTEITSANTYTGKTNILSGTGKLSHLEGFGASSNTAKELNISLGATAEFAVGGTFSQLVSGQGQVVLSGNNTLTLNNANTYRGGTTVTENGRIIADHATDGRVDALGFGTVNLTQTGSTLTVAEAGRFTNLVEGNGKVEINLDAANEWSILTGNNTYTGRTDILKGNLEVQNISGTGAQNGAIVDIADGSILRFNTTGRTDTYIKTITGGGKVEKIGSNTVILDGENSYAKGTDVKEGVLVAKNVKAVGDNRVLVSKDATFEIADGSPSGKVFANLVTGDGNFSVDAGADNVIVLDRVNDYKGDTILKSGTARLRNIDGTGENVAGTKTLVKMQGGSLEFDLGGNVGDSATYYKTIQGGGKLIKSGVDEVVIDAANGGFTGETIVNNGRLVAAHATGNTVDSFGETIVDLRSKDATVVIARKGEFANVVNGAGQLEVNLENAGEWSILSGTSSYAGRTDVKQGNVELTNIFGTGAQNGAVVDLADGSTLRFNTTGAEDTYVKTITGAGGVEKIGLNTVILDGVNTYEDGTAVNVGKLIARNVQAVGSGDVDVARNATFAVSATGEFDNLIHGAGNVEFGAGGSSEVLTVTGANDYTGMTTITKGTVSLNETLDATGLNVSDPKSGVEILADATLELATGGDYKKTIAGNGTLRKSTADTVTLHGDNSHALTELERGRTNIVTATALGKKAVMSNDTTLGITRDLNGKTVATDIDLRGSALFAVDADSVTMSGLLSGVGPLSKNGNGSLKLTNVNNSFTGLNIEKGRVVVENQGALGRGEITNLSELELIVNGATQTLRTDIKSRNGTFIKSGSGRLNMGEQNFRAGKFIMDEGQLGVQLSLGDKYFVQADNGFTVGNGSELIGMFSGANGVNRGEGNATKFLALRGAGSGDFSKYSLENELSTVKWKTLQEGNDLYYAMWLDSYTHAYDGRLSYNAEQAAEGMDRLPLDNPLVQAVNSLSSDEEMIRAFSELHGEIYMSSIFATADLQRNFNELILDRRLRCEDCRHFKGFRGQESQRGSNRRELWAMFTGGGNYRSSMDKFSGYEIGRWGVAVGLEQLFAHGFFGGVTFGYDDANMKLDDLPSKDNFHAFRVSTHLNYTIQDWSVLGYFGYAKNWHNVERNIDFLNARTKNKYDDDVITTGFELGRMIHWRTFNISPVLGLNYVTVKSPYLEETGAGPASLHVHGKRYSSLRMPMGVRTTSDIKFREVNIRPELRAFYIPEFLDSRVRGVTAYATDPTNAFFVDSGVKGRHGFRLGVGAQSWFFNCWSIGIDYDIELWQKYTRHDVGANVTVRW